MQICYSADIVIEIPGNLGQDDSSYRLDYFPPYGNPLPNTTIASKDVGDEIRFSNVLAGTKYNFWLYYTNSTHHNLLAWTVSITTGKLITFCHFAFEIFTKHIIFTQNIFITFSTLVKVFHCEAKHGKILESIIYTDKYTHKITKSNVCSYFCGEREKDEEAKNSLNIYLIEYSLLTSPWLRL